MIKKHYSVLFLLLTFATVFSQKKNAVLLTINEIPVYASEFKSVFNKNLDLVIDDSQKSVDGYLDLFIDYKIKVFEAYAQGLDKNETYIKEFSKYQDQLSKKYIYDKRVTSTLVEEAYQRGLEEIEAEHILINVPMNAYPKDTLIAYNKIKEIREKAIKGEDFETLVKTYSDEPGAKKTGGKLGYFTVFQMVYPFETAAYNTKVGKVSKIVRTEFGYHIIKVVGRRDKLPKISVSHIMIFDNEKKKNENAENRINELYAMIKQGSSFESIAKQFSEDKATGVKGGKIKTFEKGNLKAPLFEEEAYKLTEKGEMSKPVKSSFGWHIIKLNERFTNPTFEEIKEELERKVNNGARARVVTQAVNDKIKSSYGYKEGTGILPFFKNYVSDSILVKKYVYAPIPSNEDNILFTIGDREVRFNEFAKFIEKQQKPSKVYKDKIKALNDYYSVFKNKTIRDYFKTKLEEENEEYAATISEYRNGLLIFDAMQKNIWEVAKNDTIGQQAYYNNTKENYKWMQRVDVDIISANSETIAKQGQLLLEEEGDINKIKEQLNTKDKTNVIITSGVYEIDQSELPKNLEIKMGVSDIYQREESRVVVKIKEIIAPTYKSFEDVKGKVLSQYQTVVEKEWMAELHKKYKVEVNKKVLKKIKKELDR